MPSRAILVVAALALHAAIGCDGAASGDDTTDAGEDGATPSDSSGSGADTSHSTDPSCHHDCFGGASCSDGQVIVMGRGPIPCWAWKGSCGFTVAYTCKRGCRKDVTTTPWMPGSFDPTTLCEEGRPKKTGDPCATMDDCLPTPAIVYDGGVVDNVYLQCDPDAGVCATASPPIVPDYLQDCRLPDSKRPSGYTVVEAPACASGICLVSDGLTCVRQGCTVYCRGDHECPSGSTCRMDLVYDPSDDPRGACAPGPRTSAPTGIVCHDPPTDAGATGDAADSG